jgi:hypothetical protein
MNNEEEIVVKAAMLITPFSKDKNCVMIYAEIASQFNFQLGDHLTMTTKNDNIPNEGCEYEVKRLFDNGDVLVCKVHYLTAIPIAQVDGILNKKKGL